MDVDRISKQLTDDILEYTGGTVSVDTGESVQSDRGYVVAYGRGCELIAPIDLEPDASWLHDLVHGFIRSVSPVVLQGRNVGAWIDNDLLYLDVSEIVTDRDEAIALGRTREQIAIWDLRKNESIYL